MDTVTPCTPGSSVPDVATGHGTPIPRSASVQVGQRGDETREGIRRAISAPDQAGRQAVIARYDPQVRSWCRTAARGRPLDVDGAAAETWERFWRCDIAEPLGPPPVTAAVLQRLKLCAVSVVTDAARVAAAGAAPRLLPAAGDPQSVQLGAAADPADQPARAAIGRLVDDCLRSPRERLLVTCCYGLGLAPAQVTARYPEHFPSIRALYRTKRTILDRLRRSPALYILGTDACH